ncbi:MAG TPA: porin [Thermoanaerobaculaceae bacterium]|nr:porin [Thermoanaerobaculaceae bacterium]
MKKAGALAIAGLALIALGRAPNAAAADEKKDPNALKAAYNNGFNLTTANKKFELRITAAIQYRYTYMQYDHKIKGNEENYSNFYMRRARLWFAGYAYNPKFTYYFHLQLEPMSAVNLHDAWLQYQFSDLFAIGVGRNKIPYGTEFLASGFGLNFIDRSIMYGETDINAGGGYSKWPGGGTQGFGLCAEQPNTGFPVGGLSLFRSQGISATGMKHFKNGSAFQYEAGVWNGRDTKGASNAADNHLFAARLGYYPLGWINWLNQGDVDYTESFKIGILGSAYTDSKLHSKDAAGTTVANYKTDDSGYNLSVLSRYKGFSADLEWGTETFDLNRNITGPTTFDREAWRAAFGYFIVPTRIELVARYAQIERLKDPTPQAVTNSGLGFVSVKVGSAYVSAMEKQLNEITAGINFYFNKHQHKLFFDVSSLTREFARYQGTKPSNQSDKRFRSMVQFKF